MLQVKISRKSFLILMLVVVIAAALGGFRLLRRKAPADMVRAVVRKRLAYLQMGEYGLSAFVEDFLTFHSSPAFNRKLRLLGMIEPLYKHTDLLNVEPFASSLESLERRVATDLLLSSDMFSFEPDTVRAVRYVTFYDPYKSPCSNPLARF